MVELRRQAFREIKRFRGKRIAFPSLIQGQAGSLEISSSAASPFRLLFQLARTAIFISAKALAVAAAQICSTRNKGDHSRHRAGNNWAHSSRAHSNTVQLRAATVPSPNRDATSSRDASLDHAIHRTSHDAIG